MNSVQTYIKRAGEYNGILPIAENQRLITPLPTTCSVSVIIPAYNEASTILHCLESLKDQKDRSGNKRSFQTYEVIIINNNSTDATAQTVEQWIAQNKLLNFHLITESQQGVASARKRGFDEVVYRYARRKVDKPHYLLSADADNQVNSTWINDYLETFVGTKIDLIIGSSSYNQSALQSFPMIRSFAVFKEEWEVLVKNIYWGRAEGHNFGITIEAYTKVGGIKQIYYFDGDEVYQEPSDDWNFSAELIDKGFAVSFSPQITIMGNPRKLTQCIENIVKGDIYFKDWEKHLKSDKAARDFTTQEFQQISDQQLRGIFAHQMLMNIYLRPQLLDTKSSQAFLGDEIITILHTTIPRVKRLFPQHPFSVMFNYYFPSWYLYLVVGEKLYKRLQKTHAPFTHVFSLPEILKKNLARYKTDWQQEQLFYSFLLMHHRPLSQYFGGYM